MQQFKMVYWKSDRFWVGKLPEHPQIMSQGESLKEREENLRNAYLSMVLEDVREKFQVKEIMV